MFLQQQKRKDGDVFFPCSVPYSIDLELWETFNIGGGFLLTFPSML